MPEPSSSRPVKITARARAHPALRQLARACIALARLQRSPRPPARAEAAPLAAPSPGSASAADASETEANHD